MHVRGLSLSLCVAPCTPKIMNSRNPGPLVLIVAVLSFSACKKELITVREGEWEGVAPSETFSDSLAAPFAIDDCTSQEVMGLSLDPGTLHPGDLIRAVLNVGLSQVSDPPSSLCNGLEVTTGAVFDSGTQTEFDDQGEEDWTAGYWEDQFTRTLEYRVTSIGASPVVRPWVKVCLANGAVCPGVQCTVTNASLTLVVVHDHQ